MASCGTLQVVPDFSGSDVQVASCPAPDSMSPGSSQTINVGVSNQNPVAASVTVQIMDGRGNVLGSRSVNVSGNGSRSYGVEFTAPQSDGEYELNANVANVTAATASGMTQSLPFTPRTSDTGTLATVGAGLGALGLTAVTARR